VKRRLTLSILGIVAATLVLAGLGTLLFARVGARNATENDLRGQAESTAELVGLGQARLTRVTNDLQQLFCSAADLNGLSAAQKANAAAVRSELCGAPDQQDIADAQNRSCNDAASRLDKSLGDNVESARLAFCANPSTTTLQTYRDSFCSVPVNNLDATTRRRINQARTVLCLARANQANNPNIASTLQKESIQLVAIGADNQAPAGSLPEGLTVDQLDPATLRTGETVSGSVGSSVFAAAPVAAPVGANDPVRAVVIEREASPISDSVQWFLLAAGVTLALGALVAAWLSRALTHPLRQATDVTKRIAEGDLSSRLPEHEIKRGKGRPDEIDELAHSINTMADRLERSRGLERQFLLSVSHDLRTPLTSIRGYAEAIADGAAPDDQQAATVILGESRRLERLVKDLLDLAKLESQAFDFHLIDLDITEVADESVAGFRPEVESAGLHIVLYGGTTPAGAHVDPDRLQQVIANLVENAIKYASSTISVTVSGPPGPPCIEVADDGPGISPEDLPYVFERLYVASHTPKRREAGSGLGLAIVRELVEAMGGHVSAEANSTGGTRMIVTLAPAASPTATAPADPVSSEPLPNP
jgi:two-component system sensor histidine kinase BaeS